MKIKFKIVLLVVVAALAVAGCKNDWIIPEEVLDPDDPNTEEVSFSGEILPIFTSGNNCAGCHNGNQKPDLRAENAYTSLNSERYINKTTPEESRIYTVPHPDTNSHLQKKYTAAQANLVLVWIIQGAQNN